jgi:hypothetical protein
MTPYVGLRTSPQLLIPARMHGNGIKRSRSSAICTLCLVSTHFATKVHHLASSFVVFDFFFPTVTATTTRVLLYRAARQSGACARGVLFAEDKKA